jgi:hypothetical protein
MSRAVFPIEFDATAKAHIAAMEKWPESMLLAVARGMDRGANLALGAITAERFTGQGPFPIGEGKLGVKTNRLRSSLRWAPAHIEGRTVEGAMGSNVEYFGPHEFGFNGQVHVRTHSRHVASRGRFEKVERTSKKTGKTRKAKSQTASGLATVRSHTRWQQVPARAPLGHGLADHGDLFTREITAELRKTWEGKQ